MSRFFEVPCVYNAHLPTDELVMMQDKEGVWQAVWRVKHRDNYRQADTEYDSFSHEYTSQHKLILFLEDITREQAALALQRWFKKGRP